MAVGTILGRYDWGSKYSGSRKLRARDYLSQVKQDTLVAVSTRILLTSIIFLLRLLLMKPVDHLNPKSPVESRTHLAMECTNSYA